MSTSIVEYEGKQLEIDFDMNCHELLICPNCANQVVKLADGCDVCGSIEQQSIEDHKLLSSNSLISFPCLVKQPKQVEVKGIIQKDLGDRFVIEINNKTISVSKLFVYSDFSIVKQHRNKSDGQINKSSSKILTPSTKSSSKIRRKKGEGSGHIYYRNVTRNGKNYRQAYYQWREDGKQRTKYIRKNLLSRVEEAELSKLPVSSILFLLGVKDKSSSKASDTHIAFIEEKVLDTLNKSSSKILTPSKSRRARGKGSGWIECKPIKRSGREYKQYWYHYEECPKGNKSRSMTSQRKSKKSKYIPKRLVARVEKMEAEKVSVKEILKVITNNYLRF